MPYQKNTEIKVGIVSIVSILLLITGIFLGKGLSVSGNENIIKMKFSNSGGIAEYAPVMVNGVKRGTVTSVKNENGYVLISASIDNTQEFRSDVSARIMVLEIIGGKKIEIMPGNSPQPYEKNSIIQGENSADLSDLIYLVGQLSGEGKTLVRRLDTLFYSVNKIISDDGFTEKVNRTIDNTDQMILSLKNGIDRNINDIESIVKNLKQLTGDLNKSYTKYEPRLDATLSNVDKQLNNADVLLKNTNNAIRSADSMLAELKLISREIKEGKGVANKIIYDKNFSQKLDSTLNSLNGLVEHIQKYGINANVRLGGRP